MFWLLSLSGDTCFQVVASLSSSVQHLVAHPVGFEGILLLRKAHELRNEFVEELIPI
jgi:hypothetical protein